MFTSRLTSAAPTDPLEIAVANALTSAGIGYVQDWDGQLETHLDFYLPDFDIYIEVKRFHSARIAVQMARAPNVIAVQGQGAVDWLCAMLIRKR